MGLLDTSIVISMKLGCCHIFPVGVIFDTLNIRLYFNCRVSAFSYWIKLCLAYSKTCSLSKIMKTRTRRTGKLLIDNTYYELLVDLGLVTDG